MFGVDLEYKIYLSSLARTVVFWCSGRDFNKDNFIGPQVSLGILLALNLDQVWEHASNVQRPEELGQPGALMGNYNEIRYDINPYLIGDDRIYGGYIVKKPIFLIHANKESPVPNFQASLQSSCLIYRKSQNWKEVEDYCMTRSQEFDAILYLYKFLSSTTAFYRMTASKLYVQFEILAHILNKVSVLPSYCCIAYRLSCFIFPADMAFKHTWNFKQNH